MLADITRADSIYIVCGKTDMRKQIDGLCAIIEGKLHMGPDDNALFLFCGRRSDRIKGLLWEGDGFLLLYKRLSDGKFQWPRSMEEMKMMDEEQFHRLMSGFAIESSIKDANPKYIL